MRTYNELSLEGRVEMQQRLESGDSLQAIGRSLGRSPSTISRECRRAAAERSDYKAQVAQKHSQVCRKKPRVTCKLEDAEERGQVHFLRVVHVPDATPLLAEDNTELNLHFR